MTESEAMNEEEVLAEESGGANGNFGVRPPWNKPSEVAVEFGDTKIWPTLSESFGVSTKPSSDNLSSPYVSQPINNVNSTVPSPDNLSSPCVVPVSNKLNSTVMPSMNSQPPSQWRHPHSQPMNSLPPAQGLNLHPHPMNSLPVPQGPNLHPRPNLHLRRDGFHHHRPRNQNSYQNFDAMQSISAPPPPPPRPRQPLPNNIAPFVTPQPYLLPPFITPPLHLQPFGTPMRFPVSIRPGPPMPMPRMFCPPVPPMPMPIVPEPQDHLQLRAKIVNQINYYFSFENLIKDLYLRQYMDGQGWVPIELIASFKRVSHLTDNIPLILDALRSSTVVEVEGNKIRKRHDWMRWIIPPSVQIPIMSGRTSAN